MVTRCATENCKRVSYESHNKMRFFRCVALSLFLVVKLEMLYFLLRVIFLVSEKSVKFFHGFTVLSQVVS